MVSSGHPSPSQLSSSCNAGTALEAQYLQQARDSIDQFEASFAVHRRDVALLDETTRIMNSYKVRVCACF